MTLREAECRHCANKVLDDFLVGSPDEIDLDLIAWRVGRLRVIEGCMETADGRLVATSTGGTIRLRSGMRPEGRRRFTIANEIGHHLLHPTGAVPDTAVELGTWATASKETEANLFAGELLMPERLFKPRVAKMEPSLRLVDELAAEFRTSSLASAVHFVEHTPEPCAIVASKGGSILWFRRSRHFEWRLKMGRLHGYSAAGEIADEKSGDTAGMVSSPAGAWIERFDPDGKASIQEDARKVEGLDLIVSLLWVRDELDD